MTDGVQLAIPLDLDTRGTVHVYDFILPFVPPSKNVYDGWPREWQGSAKKKWVRALHRLFEMHDMPKGGLQAGLGATLVFPTARGRDTQNYANTLWHFVPDALVKYGAIPNDTPEYLDFGRNLGIRFDVDRRERFTTAQRTRTHLSIALKMPG